MKIIIFWWHSLQVLTSVNVFVLGFLKRSPHFGPVPKVIFAALVGHIYGRLSYIPNCEIKLRHLPDNSHLGNVMRKYHLENNPPKESNPKKK